MICKICGNEVTEEMLSNRLGELNSRFAYQRSLCDICYINSIEMFQDNAKVLARVAHETIQLRSDVNDSLEMNRSQSKEYFKSLLGVLSEIRNLQEEIEDVKKEIVNLSSLLLPDNSKPNSPYLRKLQPLPKQNIELQPGNKIKFGQFKWLIIDSNTVGEVRLLCEEIVAIVKYVYRDHDIVPTIRSIFSQKEISKYKITELKMPSKNDIDKAAKLNMARTDSFWLLGQIIYNNNNYLRRDEWEEHGFRPVLTVDSELLIPNK